MKTLYIIRGLPGSGKSTLACQLGRTVREADQWFTDINGNYYYVKEQIGDAHAYCQKRVELDMQVAIDNIAVSNTFVRRWEMEPYIKLAQRYGYRITEITLTGDTYGNIHNVPDEVIERMKANWEK